MGSRTMKSFAKLLLIGAVAVMAIAASAAPSEAAKKKNTAKEACSDTALCSSNCNSANCQINFCGADQKRYQAVLTPYCLTGNCPPKC